MSTVTDEHKSTRLKVGIFTILGLALIGAMTVYVNDKPFWWHGCNPVYINVTDATGLKTKSPIRSLGLQIGYLKSVELSETHVKLKICITAPVEVLPTTRAYIRAEGFLGDKFVELKPVRYVGGRNQASDDDDATPAATESPAAPVPTASPGKTQSSIWDFLIPVAYAQEAHPAAAPAPAPAPQRPAQARPRTGRGGTEVPVGGGQGDVQQVVEQVNQLVKEMTSFTENLKQAIDPKELRDTMQQLNKTLTNASKVLAPEGGLNTTAQRTLAKLEDAIEQLRDQLTRINRGEGSVGMILNDPTYAEELKKALKSLNKLLGRASEIRFVVDVGGEIIRAYDGDRGYGRLAIWPGPHRYYLVGISSDPRGKRTLTKTTTTSGSSSTTVETEQIEETGLVFTGMLGWVFFDDRLDLSVGVLHGDATGSAQLNLGPVEHETVISVRDDIYSHGTGEGLNDRIYLKFKPNVIYLTGGLESVRRVNGKLAYFGGAGIQFTDDDIKLLFAFR